MTAVKRITANLPGELLEDAMAATGKGITETLVEGLLILKGRRASQKALSLRGKLELEIDLEGSRERGGRRHLRLD